MNVVIIECREIKHRTRRRLINKWQTDVKLADFDVDKSSLVSPISAEFVQQLLALLTDVNLESYTRTTALSQCSLMKLNLP